jgi:hypothetical protein
MCERITVESRHIGAGIALDIALDCRSSSFFRSRPLFVYLGGLVMLKQTFVLALLISGGMCLQACSSFSSIPAGAVEGGHGTTDVTFVTGNAGTIYVYDRTWKTVIYSAKVEQGQRLHVNTFDGQVTLDGRVVVQRPLGENDEFSIYMDKITALAPGEELRTQRASDAP